MNNGWGYFCRREWLRVSNHPTLSGSLRAYQNGCGMSSRLCWEHAHQVNESGPDLSTLIWSPYGLLAQLRFKVTHIDFGAAHNSRLLAEINTSAPGMSQRADKTSNVQLHI